MPDRRSEAHALLRRASQEPAYSTRRKILVAAAFAAIALEDAVLVGGVAVELHTGSYRPTDIDLVGYRRPGHAELLRDLGFESQGRHWLIPLPDGETLGIEVPGDRLDDFAVEPPHILDLDPGRLAVISLNDLMIDRLYQAAGGESVTFDEAVRLAVAAYERLDWDVLEDRAARAAANGSLAGAALPDVLAKVRRQAIRLLRR